MKRPIAPVLLAALGGASVMLIALLVVGSSLGGARQHSSAAPLANASATRGATTAGAQREAAATGLSATQIYQQDSTGVVSIRAAGAQGEDSGTGIVLNDKGLILTNDHVVAGASRILAGPGKTPEATRPATLVGEEANEDLALIRIDPSGLGLKPLRLVNSSSVQVGDSVYALGNPYSLNETLTRGIVSALGREIAAPDGAKIGGAIQTDAALNPGNSGGPLLNEQGDVIGVNSQIASDAARSEGSQPGSTGVGFAIASNTAVQAIKKIEAGEGVASGSGATNGAREEGPSEAQSPRVGGSPAGPRSAPDEAEAAGPRGEGVEEGASPGGTVVTPRGEGEEAGAPIIPGAGAQGPAIVLP